MATNQLPHEGGVGGEVVAGSPSEEPVIPTQRGAPDHGPAPPPIGDGQKPILAPWMKDRAEFTYQLREVSKRAAHFVGWHLWHAPANILRVLWFAFR